MISLAEKKPVVPKIPEVFVIAEEEDDNIFFAVDVEEDLVELGLVVDVKSTGEEGIMEYLYTVYLEPENTEALIEWLKKALKYNRYVEKHGVPIKLTLGFGDDDKFRLFE